MTDLATLHDFTPEQQAAICRVERLRFERDHKEACAHHTCRGFYPHRFSPSLSTPAVLSPLRGFFSPSVTEPVLPPVARPLVRSVAGNSFKEIA